NSGSVGGAAVNILTASGGILGTQNITSKGDINIVAGNGNVAMGTLTNSGGTNANITADAKHGSTTTQVINSSGNV
ncbi:hypothetical protein ACSLVQ_30485, partial [Klebsiella pneumoniae]|uniref:hypothetical protein n=1 Tax=Klebsiella pneumoniae TaxID=573 RepID=UPI003EDED7C8